MRRWWSLSTVAAPSPPRPESSSRPAPKSAAKIEMNFPSARTAVACQIQPFAPSRSPETVGLIRAATTIAKDCMCTGRMPSTPTPRSASSAMIRAAASDTGATRVPA